MSNSDVLLVYQVWHSRGEYVVGVYATYERACKVLEACCPKKQAFPDTHKCSGPDLYCGINTWTVSEKDEKS